MSVRSKYRRVAELSECEIEELLLAATQAAKKTGEKDLEFVIRILHKGRNEVATKIRQSLETSQPQPEKISPLRGLTYVLDNRLSKAQYVRTRLLSKDFGANIFPAYKKIQQAKLECRPPKEYLQVTDVCTSLPLQMLLNHTAQRILSLQEEVIKNVALKKHSTELAVKLKVKWGFDGSSNQSQYNQKFVDAELNSMPDRRDSNLFATTLVPLQIALVDNSNTVIWNNVVPQSSRWCRPLRLQFAKESKELTLSVKDSVEHEIQMLEVCDIVIQEVNISVVYELYLTMIDGKTLTVITNTESNQRCCICRATPKEFNNLKNVSTRFKPNEGTLNFGLSVLHLWIRSFEWLLHVSYRLSVKQWQMRGPLKSELKKRKQELQIRFLEKMGLRVDFPNSGGSGNTNNGPLARSAFSKPDLLSEVLEIDETLIKKISTILIALSCQLPLDENKFAAFCDETANRYVSLYSWFPMPPSVHKLLIHSKDIMLANDLPLGVLAEDASESCNKLYRHNRQFHARKRSRQLNLTDVFNRALDSSDPIVATFGQQKRQNARRRKCLPTEVLQLLKMPESQPAEPDETLVEAEMELNDVLLDVSEGLNELCLPEDPYYAEWC